MELSSEKERKNQEKKDGGRRGEWLRDGRY
jgi:hypothetical protein